VEAIVDVGMEVEDQRSESQDEEDAVSKP
jgi:hypothetical protein